MEIFYSPQFGREYRQLPVGVKEKAKKGDEDKSSSSPVAVAWVKEKIFRKNPFDARLKPHKLKGRLDEFWAFSINYRYRIIFKFQDKNTVRFYTIGDHSIYGKL